MKTGNLYLIPNFIGDTSGSHQFPLFNVEIIGKLKYYFVENPKPARALIKQLYKEVNFDEVELFYFDKHAKDNLEIYHSIVDLLKKGNDVGILSDAGCPGIADPGSELIQLAHEKNIEVIPLIGPSSIFLTLMASGLNGQNFSFVGYLPKDSKEKSDAIKKISVQAKNTTILFIETPYKAEQTFKDLVQFLNGSNRLCLGIDLFSQTQKVITLSVSAWKAKRDVPQLKDRQVVFAVG
jgi:16S rRNA (cytidine1402-2'-O)-methyltransferase